MLNVVARRKTLFGCRLGMQTLVHSQEIFPSSVPRLSHVLVGIYLIELVRIVVVKGARRDRYLEVREAE